MATILDGLNAISQAVGGTGEAESNLEALNQISEALGGAADAENNADAVANIAENASGGGGSSDFSTAEVTFVNNSSSTVNVTLPCVYQGEGHEHDSSGTGLDVDFEESATFTIILYKSYADYSIGWNEAVQLNITYTGDVEPSPFGANIGYVKGNATFTITNPS